MGVQEGGSDECGHVTPLRQLRQFSRERALQLPPPSQQPGLSAALTEEIHQGHFEETPPQNKEAESGRAVRNRKYVIRRGRKWASRPLEVSRSGPEERRAAEGAGRERNRNRTGTGSAIMVDYSVWDHIEVSDDEDETHPNIDTASLFRWRHQARIERMEQFQKEKEELDKGCRECKRKLAECQRKLKELEMEEPKDGGGVPGGVGGVPGGGGGSSSRGGEKEKLQEEAKQLKNEERKWEKKLEELKKKEKNMPWNVDTLSKDGFSKSVFNVKAEEQEETEEQKEQKHKTFVERHEKQIKHFGMLRRWDDSQKFLSDNPQLVCEETANYLVIWCIDLEVEEKQALMEQVAHQTIVMQFILELAKSLKVDPRACFRQFFTKIKTADQQYMEGFNDELEAFKDRVRGRAKARIERAMREYEEEERQKRLGPGGLDPVEVYESLPEELQKCFDAKDVQMLQDTISRMDPTEAKFHMQRCIDSGLWVPNAKGATAAEGGGGGGGGEGAGGGNEGVYEEIKGGEHKD